MKLFFLIVLMTALVSVSKAQKQFSLAASGNFNFAVKGLGTNDAGIGFSIHSNFLAQKKLQLRVEVALDKFIGDKQLFIDSADNHYGGNSTMKSLRAGPQLYLTKNLSFSALYCLQWYDYFDTNIATDAVKFVVNANAGKRKKLIAGFYYVTEFENNGLKFFGLSLGYKIF